MAVAVDDRVGSRVTVARSLPAGAHRRKPPQQRRRGGRPPGGSRSPPAPRRCRRQQSRRSTASHAAGGQPPQQQPPGRHGHGAGVDCTGNRPPARCRPRAGRASAQRADPARQPPAQQVALRGVAVQRPARPPRCRPRTAGWSASRCRPNRSIRLTSLGGAGDDGHRGAESLRQGGDRHDVVKPEPGAAQRAASAPAERMPVVRLTLRTRQPPACRRRAPHPPSRPHLLQRLAQRVRPSAPPQTPVGQQHRPQAARRSRRERAVAGRRVVVGDRCSGVPAPAARCAAHRLTG